MTSRRGQSPSGDGDCGEVLSPGVGTGPEGRLEFAYSIDDTGPSGISGWIGNARTFPLSLGKEGIGFENDDMIVVGGRGVASGRFDE